MVDFRIRVVVDSREAQRGTSRVRRELDRTATSASGLQSSLRSAFAFIGGGLALRAATRTLASFGQELSTVGAITEASADQLAALQERAIDLGTTTRFSATQAAEGLTFLARAGFSAEEALDTVDDTLQLAQAGALDLGNAADIASNVLTGFRLSTGEAARVVDVLAAAANSSNTTVGQLGEALKFVGPVAAGVGVDIEETTAAISALSNAGLQASLAGTGLRKILAELESPSVKTLGIFQQLGVAADEVQVSQVGLTDALIRLREAGVDTGLALEIFGQRGGPAFEVLRSSVGDVQRFDAALRNADGTAARIAETMDDNLNGAILAARSALEGLTLRLGEAGGQDTLITTFNGIAISLRFLAENAEIVSVVLTSLAVGSLPAVVTGLRAVAAQSSIVQATLAGGIFSPLVIGATAASVSVALIVDELADLEAQSLRTTEAGRNFALTDFAKVGADIQDTNERLSTLQDLARKDLAAFGEVNSVLADEIERLGGRVEDLTKQQQLLADGTAGSVAEADELVVAQQALGRAVGRTIDSIAEENRLLGLNASERQIQVRLLEEIATLEEETGQAVTDEDRARLDLAVRENAQLARRSSLLDGIRGPQQEFAADLTALQQLQTDGTITTQEFNRALAELTERFEGVDLEGFDAPEVNLDGLRERIAAQAEQARLEQARAAILREVQGPLQGLLEKERILNQLAADGAINREQLTAALDANREAVNRLNPDYARQQTLLESIVGPAREYRQTVADLKVLLDDGSITLDQYNLKLEQLAVSQQRAVVGSDGLVAAQGRLQGGLQRGLAGITDVAGATETALVNAFGAAEDAIVQFATTGEFNVSSFVDGLLADVSRILARQAVLGLINAFTGGGAGAGGAGGILNLFGGNRESGGPVEPGKAFVVGEGGRREVFAPPGAGNIMSAAQAAAMANGDTQPTVVQSPAPSVNIINVMDPEEITAAMSSPEGEQVVLNIISRNRTAVQNSLNS